MTNKELDDAALADLIADAEAAERQAVNGPFFHNVTPEELLNYARECRAKIARYSNGGAHEAVLYGRD